MLGNGNKFFEVGLGATYFAFKDRNDDDLFLDFDSGNTVAGTMTFGYRYQPQNGFSFRAGVTPIFNTHQFIPYWFGVSFGYAF